MIAAPAGGTMERSKQCKTVEQNGTVGLWGPLKGEGQRGVGLGLMP